MGWFIVSIVFVIVAIIGLIASRMAGDDKVAVAAISVMMVGLLVFAVSGIKDVPTKSIGVPVALGRVVGNPYGPGLHETWKPWLKLHVVDETIQTTTFEGCQGVYCQHGDQAGATTPPSGDSGTSSAPCLEVRIGGGQTGCLDVTIQWQVRDGAADSLFTDYANSSLLMPTIEDSVVIRELRQVVNTELGDYNPIEDTSAITGTGSSQFTGFQS